MPFVMSPQIRQDLYWPVQTSDHQGYTILNHAAYNGHLDIVKYLVEQGCDVNILAQNNETALDKATENGHHNVVEYLFILKIVFVLGKINPPVCL